MSQELTEVKSLGELANQAESVGLLAELSKTKGLLPYLQLFTTKSTAVAEEKIGGGHYGLVRDTDTIVDLGKEISVWFLAVRARAYHKDGDNVTVVFDRSDPDYQRIEAAQANKVQGAMAGPELLVYVPDEDAFCTFFCGSTTLKKEARKWGQFIGQKVTLGSKPIRNKYGAWQGPTTQACTQELTEPEVTDLNKVLTEFKNPRKFSPGEKVAPGVAPDVDR